MAVYMFRMLQILLQSYLMVEYRVFKGGDKMWADHLVKRLPICQNTNIQNAHARMQPLTVESEEISLIPFLLHQDSL